MIGGSQVYGQGCHIKNDAVGLLQISVNLCERDGYRWWILG